MKRIFLIFIFLSGLAGLGLSAGGILAFHDGGSSSYGSVRLSESHSSSGTGPNGVISVNVSTNNVYTNYYWSKVLGAHVDGNVKWSNPVRSYGTGVNLYSGFTGLSGGNHQVGGDALLYWWDGKAYKFWANLSAGPSTVNIPSPAPPVCSPNWSCTGWSTCSGGTQTRTCTDSNNCGTTSGKPSTSQTCVMPFDYSLSASGNISVNRGSSGSNTITASLTSGSTQSVSFSVSGLPYQTSASGLSSCNPTCSRTLTISTGGQTPAGTFPITVSSGGKSTAFSLIVTEPFNYSLSASGNISVNRGSSGSNTITVSKNSGTAQNVSLSVSGLPSQASSARFSPTSCSPNNTCSSTLTITTMEEMQTGTYPVTVTGSPLGRTATFNLVVSDAFSYSLSASGNISVNRGSSGSNTITVSKNSGTAQNVSLSVSGLPSQASSARFSPTSCTPNNNCTSTLTITAMEEMPAGTYPVTVTGSPLGRTATFNLTVSAPAAPLTASCSADKTKATLKESVKWSAAASGGGGGYNYVWGGTAPLSGKTGSSASVTYTATGNKTGSVTVTSGSQLKTVNCSNAVDVYAPAVKISPSDVRIKVDETAQLKVDYYPYGLAITNVFQNITNSAHWFSSDNRIAVANDTSKKGLVTGVKAGSASIYTSYTDQYGNFVSTSVNNGTTAAVTVTDPTSLTISIKTHPNSPGAILVNQNVTFEAKYGISGYSWSGGGAPASGSGSEFTTKYTSSGSKTVTVTSGSKSQNETFTVAQPTLTLDSLTALPAAGKTALDVSLTANTSSNMESTANYTFWWNCANSGASVSAVKAVCGDPAVGAVGAKFDGVPEKNKSVSHAYSVSGNYTAKVIVERGGVSPQEKRVSISAGKVDIKAQASDGPVNLAVGAYAGLTWTSENMTSCTASGTGPNWSGSKPLGDPIAYADATDVFSQPGTYRYTLTCSGANGLSVSDYVDIVVASSLGIDSFNVIPPGPKAGGLTSDMSVSISSNITGASNNYTFYCSNATPDSDTTVTGGWDHKRDGVSEMSYRADQVCNYNYYSPGIYAAKVIVERGGLARAAHTDITILSNVAPAVSVMAPSAPANYCASPFGWVLRWNFSDAGGDSQQSYQVVVKDAASGAAVKDSGRVVSSSNSYAIPLGTLDFNKTYAWTVKVWESNAAGLTAEAVGGSFTTVKHAAPALSFNVSPARPSRDEQVTLTDTTVVSGGAAKANWNWDFAGVDGVTLLSPATAQQVVVKFSTSGSKNVKLKVTDSDGLNCEKGANDDANDSLANITVGRGIPLFREVLPR